MTIRAVLLSAVLSLPALAGDWEQIYEEDGVTVSRKDVEGTKLFAFKGDTVFDAEVGKVLYVLLDNDHRTEWVGRLAYNEILERNSQFDYVLYQAFELPAMFADRDYVYHGVVTRDIETEVVTLSMQSVEHPEAPETVGVRAELINSRYLLTPIADGKTRIEVEIITDPKGWMPAWLVNIIQKSWPVDTLNALRGQLDEPYTLVHALPGEDEEPDVRVAESDEESEDHATPDAKLDTPAEPTPEPEPVPTD